MQIKSDDKNISILRLHDGIEVKTKEVIVTGKENTGYDELCCDYYKCPNCEEEYIVEGFKYCPKCGVKINWTKVEVTEVEGLSGNVYYNKKGRKK
jgi:hypothetical protein